MIPAVKRNSKTKLRVAAYCRVSTNHHEQSSSIAYQQRTYKKMIDNNPDWEFAGIFSDVGKTGTTTTNRFGFMNMIRMCILGRIDLIITKSVTRFARNTLDTIEVVRALKNMDVGVYFEKERINSLSSEGELLLTLLAMYAQEESYNTSQNIKWSIRKRMTDGSFTPSALPIGYKYVDGKVVIDRETAHAVREIFDLYLSGEGAYRIASYLNRTKRLIKKSGKQWCMTDIKRILRNPIYRGKMILQQSFTTDSLPRIRRKNTGQLDRFHYIDNHQTLINESEAEAIDAIIKEKTDKYSPNYVDNSSFSNLLYDGVYRQKPIRSVKLLSDGKTKVVYRFLDFPFSDGRISSLTIKHDEIELLSKRMVYKLLQTNLLKNYRSVLIKASDVVENHMEFKKISSRMKKAGILNHLLMSSDSPAFSIEMGREGMEVHNDEVVNFILTINATELIINEFGNINDVNITDIKHLFDRICKSISVYEDKLIFNLVNGLCLEEMR